MSSMYTAACRTISDVPKRDQAPRTVVLRVRNAKGHFKLKRVHNSLLFS
jgi:hypothetical protein